jgi:hypothetical protein
MQEKKGGVHVVNTPIQKWQTCSGENSKTNANNGDAKRIGKKNRLCWVHFTHERKRD